MFISTKEYNNAVVHSYLIRDGLLFFNAIAQSFRRWSLTLATVYWIMLDVVKTLKMSSSRKYCSTYGKLMLSKYKQSEMEDRQKFEPKRIFCVIERF